MKNSKNNLVALGWLASSAEEYDFGSFQKELKMFWEREVPVGRLIKDRVLGPRARPCFIWESDGMYFYLSNVTTQKQAIDYLAQKLKKGLKKLSANQMSYVEEDFDTQFIRKVIK